MEITTQTFLLLLSMAFACEFIDSAAGMGYGTILAPLLIAMGFAPHAAVPAVLISQAFGGLAASIFHHRFENVSFARDSRDLKVVLVISALGIVATVAGALVSVNLPAAALKTYIGVLVTIMGVVVLCNRPAAFAWKKIVGLAGYGKPLFLGLGLMAVTISAISYAGTLLIWRMAVVLKRRRPVRLRAGA